MGQGGSKPPLRQVIPLDEKQTNNEEEEEETEDRNMDMLGVSAEESDYPEPKPPFKASKEVKNQPEHIPVMTFNTSDTTRPQDGEKYSTKSILGEEYQVELVPVGASFKNSLTKGVEVRNEIESLPSESKTSWSSYPVVRTIATSLSLRDSLQGSIHMNSSGTLSGVSQREAMLADRERREYLKLMAPSSETVTHKGQIRRYNYDGPHQNASSNYTDKFRNVEDRLADEIANKHRDHRAETYASLVKDITAGVNSDRLKVKIILAWMSKQNIGRLQFGPKLPAPDTPNGYMMLMQEGKGTFPVFFTLLCREAKLKCAIISGISKGSHYEVGSKDIESLKNTWNAVYVEGSWQLVHPLWVCKGVANRQLGGWMKIEEEGKAQRKLSVASMGRDLPSFNPYFIFTRPEEFIYRHFPDEERWQLLQKPLTLDEFLKLTYIRPIFFQNNFKLQSEDSCILESESGEPCEIKISFPNQQAFDSVFGYDLSIKVNEDSNGEEEKNNDTDSNGEEEKNNDTDSNGDEEENNDTDETSRETIEYLKETERFVMVKKAESCVIFEVRFFVKGTYKLRLYGGYFKEFANKPPWIIDVLLKCNNVKPQVIPLPFDSGPVGWGPGPVSENLGLYVPSHVESEVNVNDEEDTIIYFILLEKLNVTVELRHCTINKSNLQEFVETSTIKIGDIITLQIRLMYPGTGEFGLKIDVLSQQMTVNACNYIVHTSNKRPFESFYPRRARRMLLNAMETCDLDFLKFALEECERCGLQDSDPDIRGAKQRFEFLSCKTAKETAKVDEHLQKLLKLDEGGWTCDIPEIDRQSLVELSQLRKPKLEVRLVITAMYMLLGIEEENLKEWAKVRAFLRNQQSTLIEMARLEKYLLLGTTKDVTVASPVLDRVQEILMNFTLEDIRRADNTAAAYFQWVISVTEKLKDTRRKLDERSLIASAKSGKSVGKDIKISNNDVLISRSLSKTSSLTSKTLFTIASSNSRRETDSVVDRPLRSSRNKSRMTVNKLSGLKPITEENDQFLKTDIRDTKSQKSLPTISSTLTLVSKPEKLSKIDSRMTSSRISRSSSREVSVNKSLSSLNKRPVSENRATMITPSVTKSLEKDTLSNASSFRNKSVLGKTPVSLSHESNDKKAKTITRNKSQDTIKSTIPSRKSSIATRKSVTNVSKSPQNSSRSLKTDAKKDQKVDSNGIHRIHSFRSEEITGKTFFSESGNSHRSTTSRPASIRSKVSRNELRP